MEVTPAAYELPDMHWDTWPAKLTELWHTYDPHGVLFAFLATLFAIFVVVWLLVATPKFLDRWEIRHLTRKEEQEMRREREGIQQKTFADAVEDSIAFLLDEGDMTPDEARTWRSFFQQKIPDLRKPVDVKIGILARFYAGWYDKKAPLPDAVQTTTTVLVTGRFGNMKP